MNQKTSPIIKPEELVTLDQSENLIIANAGNGKAAGGILCRRRKSFARRSEIWEFRRKAVS
jgi:hypothetical protein